MPLLVFLVSLFFYLITLAPTIFDGLDSIEYTTSAYRLGIPHSTGYPLYLILGKAFTYLPFGDVGYRINLMSAVFAAATSMLVFKISLMLTRRAIPSLAAALFFSFSYYVWFLAVRAEVYTLQAFLTAFIIFLWFRWEASGNRKLIYGAAFVWGLSFGNHMTIGLLGPAFSYLLLRGLFTRTIRWRDVALVPLLVAFGFVLIYAYLPWRYLADATPNVLGTYTGNGEFVRVDLTSWEGLRWTLTGREYGQLFFAYDIPGFFDQFGEYLKLLYGNFLSIGLLPGLVGLIYLAFTRRHQFTVLFLAFGFYLFFLVNYGAFDKETMYIPTYVIWAVFMGVGLAYISNLLEKYRTGVHLSLGRRLGKAVARIPWQTALLLLPLGALLINFSYADVSSEKNVKEDYREFLETVDPDALILAGYLDAWPIQYLIRS